MLKNLLLLVVVLAHGLMVSAQTDMNIPIKGICIYIDYPDAPINVSHNQLDDLLNDMDLQSPVVNRSFRSYWYQASRRNVDIQHDIFYYTAPLPSSYYATLPWYEGIDLWQEALEAVIAQNPNYDWNSLSKWSPADPFDAEHPNFYTNGIKATTIISSVWGPAGVGAAHFPDWTLSNGMRIGSIQGSVLQAPWHQTINLFVLIHEAGHSIFQLPDTYDYDASSGGTAKYSLMSAQGPDVEPIGAPFLYKHNWGYVKEPTTGSQTYILPADGDTVVVIKNIHDPKEFFALEVRKNSTLGNSLFPVPIGLLVWHSDWKVHTTNTLENRTRYAHYQHSIVQKDGLFELESSRPDIDAGDIYVAGDELSATTLPNTNWWSGEASGVTIKDIVILDADRIQFTVELEEPHAEHYDFIPKDDWVLVDQTLPQPGYEGALAFDSDISTYFHVPFGSNHPRPHELIIDLGAVYELTEFYYKANDNYSPPWEGRIKDYEVYLSMEEDNFSAPIIEAQFFQTEWRQYALFPPQEGRYIKLAALNSYLNDDRTSVAEIDLRGRPSTASSSDEVAGNSANKMLVSPNPTADVLHISNLNPTHTVKLFSPIGELLGVYSGEAETQHIDVSELPSGVIFIAVYEEFGNQVFTSKVVKM